MIVDILQQSVFVKTRLLNTLKFTVTKHEFRYDDGFTFVT